MSNFLVRYVDNSDGSSTGAVNLGGDRPPLVLGGVEGEVTSEEFALLVTKGLVLEVVGKGFDDLTVAELKARLDEYGVEYENSAKKDELVELVRNASTDAELPSPAQDPSTGPSAGETKGGSGGTVPLSGPAGAGGMVA
jgi:hypothetical protein